MKRLIAAVLAATITAAHAQTPIKIGVLTLVGRDVGGGGRMKNNKLTSQDIHGSKS